ncbi:MAG: trimethylamine methyltransferase family protein, partial [Mesorhizobium sp.]|nr:trimethylamine methyltransferase family protein [Mesorhizobium sp.]
GVRRIHEAALDALENIGLANAPRSGVEIMTGAGAILGEDGRIRFPRALVEDMLALAARDITLYGRDPRYDLELSGTRVYYGTAGAAVHIVDVEKREYRESTARDLYNAAQLVHHLDNVHFFQRAMVCRDVPDNFLMDINTLYACVMGTSKHVGTSFTVRENVAPALEMLYAIAGGEENFRARPFVSNSNCFVVPPMKFAEESCITMEACIRAGMPILLLSAGQAGATAPAPLATAIVQAVAECLAGVVYVNAMAPGHPAIFGTWPFVSDLRTGAMSGGSAEQSVLTAACAQMAQFYDLPGGSAAGMTDSKLPDIQSGYEKGITDVMAGLSGLNLVYESAGMHASLLGFCLESLIIDNDMLGHCLRCVRGIEVTDESLSIDTITDVCIKGPGHYLGNEQTLRLMQTEYFYPAVGDRFSPKEWNEKGRPDILSRAIAEKKRILAERFPRHIPRSVDDKLRARFGNLIHLPRTGMGG